MTTTFYLDTFKGGRDLRLGKFAGKKKDHFRELTNYYTGKDGFLHRRYPFRAVTGTLSANSQGLVLLNGALYSIGKKGDTITHTVGSPVINTVLFDNPDHCTTWQLIQARVFNGKVVALIRHTFPGGAVTSRIFLHVFDGSTSKPTYVEDPYCPTSWAPTFPLHLYRTGTLGAFADYNPRMAVAANKLYISGPDGNVYFSKAKNARVWNTRTADEILNGGEWWYFITNSTSGAQNFIVSEDGTILSDMEKWCSGVLEYCDANGTWQRGAERSANTSVDKDYYLTSVASRFGGTNEINVRLYWTGGSGKLIRFRLIAADSALSLNNFTAVNQKSFRFSGDGVIDEFTSPDMVLDPGSGYTVYENGVEVNQTFFPAGPGLVSITITSANSILLQFGTPPVAGTDNVVILQAAYLASQAGSSIVYEGQVYDVPAEAIGVKFKYWALIVQPPSSDRYFYYTYLAPIDPQNALNFLFRSFEFSPLAELLSERYVKFFRVRLTSDGTATPNQVVTIADFFYRDDLTNKTSFYLTKQIDYQANQAGFGEAGFLPAQSKNNKGGFVVDLSSSGSRLIVHYSEQSQLWAVFTDQTQDQLLDDSSIGNGNHTGGISVKFYGESVVLTARGIRAFSSSNFNNDNLEDNNIGSPIEEFSTYNLTAGAFWPFNGKMCLALDSGSATELHVFDYSKDEKVSSWSKWESLNLGRVANDGIIPINGKMYVLRTDRTMVYADAESSSYRDDADGATPYLSRVRWPMLNTDRPRESKDWIEMGLSVQGAFVMKFDQLSDGVEFEIPGPVSTGNTFGQGKIDLGMNAQAIGPIIESTDVEGSVIEAIEIDYNLTR